MERSRKPARRPMPAIVPITDPAELIARLGAVTPIALDRDAALAPAEGVRFAFAWRDVPFSSTIEGRGEEAVLTVSGELGPMPFTIEAAHRRQRALRTLAAACRWTDLAWRLTPAHQIVVEGEARLAQPVSPAAMIAGAVGILARADRYLALLLDVLGDAECLNVPAAA